MAESYVEAHVYRGRRLLFRILGGHAVATWGSITLTNNSLLLFATLPRRRRSTITARTDRSVNAKVKECGEATAAHGFIV